MITEEVKDYIRRSVLCWLATSNKNNEPNVSPKEMFTYYGETTLLIAHIASPNTVENINANPNVCVSFIDVFVQKGYKIKGIAKIIEKTDSTYPEKLNVLTDLFSNRFPIRSIIEIEVKKVDTIVAPSYYLYPETTEESQVESALKTYQVKAVHTNKMHG
ncbi:MULTISPECIES: pyridoxamine 5'-phosphate oxidase family protein [Chryseobacterium]|uniref:Pyridoxine 5'-phosphate oxidase superfamily flavin-nucleotide-binding protein n=1 Tax=Chryseobacterium camelliae TaxID=1265445 RepID=A0ABU0TKN0_9FLAO|nr:MULTISPECIES: pyridoxamine 5'-phosphate oxidase family protein [Chryseobacterium]MDT3408544.1 putative pyridoxine 5'-phosphate oxidase superfamily flavin-nucleotide-binding protein [Pseudacidovorax intermedius]MDQ1097601.1 putative pyridoxine 5'-phosphate oxidase superfamily flavin-nucleotide-binding protein [Chryseobacterium camelliae]MDQ1101530.1 putative pyridoxine 5'-phosphate oxidase superfamily flavin-nucleotide-binding protein [Chryseobacterium sp. SORGH_AS_1048]MDR6084973.1 putative 